MTIDISNGKTIDQLAAVARAADTDLLIVKTPKGTKYVTKAELLAEITPNDYLNEGRDLTAVFADEIANFSDPWAWAQDRLDKGNFGDIREGDYITITLTTGEVVDMQIAGICTHTGIFSGAVKAHIDWISRDCLNDTHAWNGSNDNNGTSAEPQPFIASAVYAWLESTVYPTLPQEVRNIIKGKRLYMPTRYNASSKLTDDASWADKTFPHLWLPFEGEIFEHASWSTKGFGTACCVQYPLFANSWKARMKREGKGGTLVYWWTASAYSGSATRVVYVYTGGMSDHNNASVADGVPVCFRQMAAA